MRGHTPNRNAKLPPDPPKLDDVKRRYPGAYRIDLPNLTDAERAKMLEILNQPGGEIVHYTPGMHGRTIVDGTYKGVPYRLSVGDVGSGTVEECQAILDEIQKVLGATDA